jgi:hypothetical protein
MGMLPPTGVWNAGSGKAEFKSSPYVFDIETHEVDRAQIEATLWEPAPDGCLCVGVGMHERHACVCERWCLGMCCFAGVVCGFTRRVVRTQKRNTDLS